MTVLQTIRTTVGRLRADERGTTMTEFVLTLPIFIFMFVGILRIGTVTSHSVVVDARAYKKMWEAALPVSKQQFNVVHMVPATAGARALADVRYEHTTTTAQRVAVMAAEAAAYGGLAMNGTMGESYARVRPIDPMFNLLDLERRVESSWNNRLIGSSAYVRDLMDESADFRIRGGGALAVLNSVLSATGTRPAIAAGMRYGAVVGVESDSSNWLRFPVSYRAHFNTLVAPHPMGTYGGELITTAVTRLTMESHTPYKEVLGIAWSQPLSSRSISVPDLKPVFWAPCMASGCDPGGP